MFTGSREKEFQFTFREVEVLVNNKKVLDNIDGHVSHGELLVVSGPTGSGKSTLLSLLAGYITPSSGEICMNGRAIDHSQHEVTFVERQDLFLPTLTVQETLKYTALLRLPNLSVEEKEYRVKELVNLFELDTCFNIIVQLVTPGVRKKLGVACEMLLDPLVLLVDEPDLGLDYKEGLDLLKTLKLYTEKSNKSVIVTLQNCPSILFQKCTNIMFLYHGEMAFYGKPGELSDFLSKLDVKFQTIYNPAEKMMELLIETVYNDNEKVQDKILEHFNRIRVSSDWKTKSFAIESNHHGNENNHSNKKDSFELAKYQNNHALQTELEKDEVKVLIQKQKYSSKSNTTWTTPFSHQMMVLFVRNLQNARRRILFPISIVQNFYILVICVLIWWRVERREDTIKDRLGLFFFTVVQWAFFALLDAILTFPKELKVINKERKQRQYRLSAFCLSKTLSEIPLAVLQPCVYMCVIYWVANLNSLYAFFASIGVLMLDVLAAQSIGLFVGTALRPPWTVSVVSLGLLSMMLWGGAFNTPPVWLRWGKYASYFFYGLNAFILLEFKNAPPIQCLPPNMTIVPVCKMINPATNETYTEFDSELVLFIQQINWPLWQYILVLVLIMLVTRILWYILLRRQKLI